MSASASNNRLSNSQFSFLLEVDFQISHFRQSSHNQHYRSFFPLDKVPSTLEIDALLRTSFLVLDHMSALHHVFTTLVGAGCGLPLAAALLMKNRRSVRKLRLWW